MNTLIAFYLTFVKNPTRPLIFIAHSLGGIVTKQVCFFVLQACKVNIDRIRQSSRWPTERVQ
jgi:hypothetical protein